MLLKHVVIYAATGRFDACVEAQRTWNRETRGADGHLATLMDTDEATGRIDAFILWTDRESYEAWMRDDHDRIAAEAGVDRVAHEVSVRVVDEGPVLELRGPGVWRRVAAADAVGAAGRLLDRDNVDPGVTHGTVVSRDGGYRASVPLSDLLDGGVLSIEDGALRMVVEGGSTLCWNVKDVGSIELTAGPQPDSVPENPPH